jgi:nucleoid-associated protein YgaU
VAGLLLYNYFSKNKPGETTPNETSTEEKRAVEVAILPTTHTVSDNETLWSIAEKYYQSGYNWVTIVSENKLENPDLITAGQSLVIPKAETIKPASGEISAAAVEPAKTYTVIPGDNLWSIAVREYGDGFSWTKIAKANNLVNPDLIHAGNILTLPR